MKDISILIPTYNAVCTELVGALLQQAEALAADYEIIVADDGSTHPEVTAANRVINQLPHCQYVERGFNAGRAAIRNFLASQARHSWLLFIDSDMVVCRNDYLSQYACSAEDADIVYGGVTIGQLQAGNLRSMYEKAAEPEHTVARRRQSPYHDFHTANFLVRRQLMLDHPFDERFRHYGYEDVLFGKQMEQQHIGIAHIDNPLSFEHFETNADFLSKTEEGLRTLHHFRAELRGYSRLLDATEQSAVIRCCKPIIRLLHRICGPWIRKRLTSKHPNLLLFKAYKFGYFLSL